MGFHVTTADLRSARATLKDLAKDTAKAKTYVASHMTVSAGDGGALFRHVGGVNESVVERLTTMLGRLDEVLRQSGTELGSVARMYDVTDSTSETRSDRLMDRTTRVPLEDRLGARPRVPDTVPEKDS